MSTTTSEPRDLVSAIHEIISKVRSRNGLSISPEESRETTVSLKELCDLPEAEAVFKAYRAVLGRTPDLAGFRTYVTALRHGTLSRRRFLEALQSAPEAKSRRVRILHDATSQEVAAAGLSRTAPERVFYTVSDFAAEDLDGFLRKAYRIILKRDPDPSGLASYREAVAKGTTHTQVLASLLASDECKSRGQPVIIYGVTPVDDMLGALFVAVNGMSSMIVELEYQLNVMKTSHGEA